MDLPSFMPGSLGNASLKTVGIGDGQLPTVHLPMSTMDIVLSPPFRLTGNVLSIDAVTSLVAGLMTSAEWALLDSIPASIAAKFTTPTGTTLQYLRGDGTTATFPVLATVATSGSYNDLSNKPTIGTGSVTSVALTLPTGLSVSGSPVTTSGTLTVSCALSGIIQVSGGAFSAITVGSGLSFTGGTLTSNNSGTVTSVTAGTGLSGGTITTTGTISLPNTGTAGTYNTVTTDAQGRVTAGAARSINNAPNRSAYIVSVAAAANGFQISSTRDAQASYSISIQVNATGLIAGASSGYVVFEIAATNSTTAGDWTEIGRWTNGQSFTSILSLSSAQPIGSDITKVVPAGYYARFRSVNVVGTPTYTYNSGQECLL